MAAEMLKKLVLPMTVMVLSTALYALERKTIFIDNMNGFEVYIERAIQNAELSSRVDLVEEVQHSDFKAQLKKRFSSAYEAALFKKQTGRNEDTTLTLTDVASDKALFTHHFTMSSSEKAKQVAAGEFVAKLKRLLDKTD